MARFAAKKTTTDEDILTAEYEHGYSFSTDGYAHISKPGLTEQTVREISHIKEEPEWMLKARLEAYKQFVAKKTPTWGADLSEINYDAIRYYLRATDEQKKSWDDVPPEVKETFDRLGIPEAERSVLAGVKAQWDSEMVYGSLHNVWADQGVVFLSMDEGLKQYPDLVKEYFGKVIPSGDNKFSALNTAVWSGGSFVYVPPGVEVKMPLQTYFRINAENSGQFERTLIIVDEGAKVHYIEGCFVAGTQITTLEGQVNVEDITEQDQVLTHEGRFQPVTQLKPRSYSGDLCTFSVVGQPDEITATANHPFLAVKRQYKNERNKKWELRWMAAKDLKKGDYLTVPIPRKQLDIKEMTFEVPVGAGRHGWQLEPIKVPLNKEFFRLIGYYLAEGSISAGSYLNFSFHEDELEYIDDVKKCLTSVFPDYKAKIAESKHEKNHGVNVVVRSVALCRIFELFGTSSSNKQVPEWVMESPFKLQAELLKAWYFGDGSYYAKQNSHGWKENFRISSVSKSLILQGRMLLARQGIAASLNTQVRSKPSNSVVYDRSRANRKDMHTLVIGGEHMVSFGNLVGQPIQPKINDKKRATPYHIDEKYLYVPIKKTDTEAVTDHPVYNFSVAEDESYVANGLAVHNCTAPNFSTGSLHSAVVEIFVKPGARCQYTTVQNWYKNIYNLVTKRAYVEAEGEMVWTDFNMGSKVTMKYPGFVLAGKGARGETLSMALAGAGQHQDTGSKAIHLAPHTSSTILSKSISKDGGRTSYRGLVNVGPHAHHSQNTVICDALLLDGQSRSDTYPVDTIHTNKVAVQHEATVSKIGDDQLFYLMSRGVKEEDARKMIVNGFIEDLVRHLPLEYAVEMNRLIDHEMEGSIG